MIKKEGIKNKKQSCEENGIYGIFFASQDVIECVVKVMKTLTDKFGHLVSLDVWLIYVHFVFRSK